MKRILTAAMIFVASILLSMPLQAMPKGMLQNGEFILAAPCHGDIEIGEDNFPGIFNELLKPGVYDMVMQRLSPRGISCNTDGSLGLLELLFENNGKDWISLLIKGLKHSNRAIVQEAEEVALAEMRPVIETNKIEQRQQTLSGLYVYPDKVIATSGSDSITIIPEKKSALFLILSNRELFDDFNTILIKSEDLGCEETREIANKNIIKGANNPNAHFDENQGWNDFMIGLKCSDTKLVDQSDNWYKGVVYPVSQVKQNSLQQENSQTEADKEDKKIFGDHFKQIDLYAKKHPECKNVIYSENAERVGCEHDPQLQKEEAESFIGIANVDHSEKNRYCSDLYNNALVLSLCADPAFRNWKNYVTEYKPDVQHKAEILYSRQENKFLKAHTQCLIAGKDNLDSMSCTQKVSREACVELRDLHWTGSFLDYTYTPENGVKNCQKFLGKDAFKYDAKHNKKLESMRTD